MTEPYIYTNSVDMFSAGIVVQLMMDGNIKNYKGVIKAARKKIISPKIPFILVRSVKFFVYLAIDFFCILAFRNLIIHLLLRN